MSNIKFFPFLSTNKRVQSIEACRLLASIAVVFIHCRMPGNLGEIANGLARFAVPFFFVVSGYFTFNATLDQIRKRMIGTAKLNIFSTLLYLLWKSYKTRYIFGESRILWFKNSLSIHNIASWVFLNTNPFSEHLWYLNAIFICYYLIYLYISWKNNSSTSFHTLYKISFLLLLLHLSLGTFATAVQHDFPNLIYRNALFFGLPMFTLGLFLREYQDNFFTVFHLSNVVLWCLILLGGILVLLERFGFGKVDLHIGSIVTVISLMLLLISNPQVTQNNQILLKAIPKFGSLSTWIYVTHVFWKDLFLTFSLERYIDNTFGKHLTAYILPFVVITISLFTGIIWEIVRAIVHRFKHNFNNN